MNKLSCRTILCSAVLGAIAIAPTLNAQMSGMSAPGTMASGPVAPSKVYADLFKSEMDEILSAAEAMPAEKYDFAPPASAGTFDGVRTFAGQVKHLTSANYGFFSAFGMKPTMTRDQINALKSKDEIVKAFKDSIDFANQAIATITPQNAFAPVMMGKETQTRAGLAAFCLAHANDHYGQMVEYLRMNNIIPPASVKK